MGHYGIICLGFAKRGLTGLGYGICIGLDILVEMHRALWFEDRGQSGITG
jgi:hypothetical protein